MANTVSLVAVLEQKAIVKKTTSHVLLPPQPQRQSCLVDAPCVSNLPLYPAVYCVIMPVILSPCLYIPINIALSPLSSQI